MSKTVFQFPEHEKGEQSPDSRIRKLDKIAKQLNIQIHVDGIVYGAELKKARKAPALEDYTVVADTVNETPKKSSSKKKKAVDSE